MLLDSRQKNKRLSTKLQHVFPHFSESLTFPSIQILLFLLVVLNMKLVEPKPIHDDSGHSTSPLQIDAMGSNAHIPLTQQPMDTLQKYFLWLLLEPLHHH